MCIFAGGDRWQCQRLGPPRGRFLLHRRALVAPAPWRDSDARVWLWWPGVCLHREVQHSLRCDHRHQSGSRRLHPVWLLRLLLRHQLLLLWVSLVCRSLHCSNDLCVLVHHSVKTQKLLKERDKKFSKAKMLQCIVLYKGKHQVFTKK